MAGKPKNIIGQKFNRLTVLEDTGKRKNGSVVWLCKCDCGNICEVCGGSLTRSKHPIKSCGCLKKETDKQPKGNVINLINQKFGKLTVIQRDGSDARGEAKWICECECGNKISVLGSNLRSGHTQSCGCERRSHGELKVAEILRENSIPFEQEHKAFKFSNGSWAKFDFFVNNEYLIEYDGETHYISNLHGWHTEEQLQAQLERDAIKNQWCKENNIPLIRIPYTHLKDLCIEDLLLETSNYVVV